MIAPGGSVIFGKEAMEHYKEISQIVYLKLSYQEVERRIGNVVDRGVVLKEGQTLKDLYDEESPIMKSMQTLLLTKQAIRQAVL